jgi:signal transduction histidine kinase
MPKVLIADDNDENRYLLEAILQNNGFETVSAANGEEALNLAMQHPPEVIITDILMPVMDGYDLCRQWKADDKLKRIPFVFYTATYTDQRDIEFGLSLGAERFLLKPQEPDVILQVLNEVLGEVKAVGVPAKTCSPLGEEMEFFRQHNEVLFRKLEKKMAELKDANAAFQREIKERQQVEVALVKAKESAEAANLAKSRFLANMSHELRTPITGVLGAIQVALSGPLDDEQRDLLKIANNSGKRLVRIISDILDLTRIEAGKLPIKEKEFILGEFVAGMNDIFIPETRRKGIEIFHDMAPDLPYKVIGDKSRLQQILNNLVGNAVKFTEQGKVEVLVRPGKTAPDGRLEIVFTIRDTGVGIPADKRDIIFDFFTQADDSDTRRYGGIGLGLTISRELAARMGGSIGFESKEGVGSSFFFTIPFEVYEAQEDDGTKCEEN